MGSPGDNIKVGFDSVQNVEAQLSATLKKLQSRLDQLDSDLRPIHDSWTGQAKAAYRIDKDKWDKAAQDMNLVLAQLKKAVGAAHETYVKVSAQTAHMFG
jgi:early secretory antigenic target protein ESAT-6